MYYLNENEKRDSMNSCQLDILRNAVSESDFVSVSMKRAPSVIQQQQNKEKRNKSTTCHNILLAATIIQFFIIISACTAFAFSQYGICNTRSVKSTLKGKPRGLAP